MQLSSDTVALKKFSDINQNILVKQTTQFKLSLL